MGRALSKKRRRRKKVNHKKITKIVLGRRKAFLLVRGGVVEKNCLSGRRSNFETNLRGKYALPIRRLTPGAKRKRKEATRKGRKQKHRVLQWKKCLGEKKERRKFRGKDGGNSGGSRGGGGVPKKAGRLPDTWEKGKNESDKKRKGFQPTHSEKRKDFPQEKRF